MHLIYYSHSYRKADNAINEFIQDLMLGEELTPSLDPPSDRLNSAKPERHLRSTDGVIAVLPARDPAPSSYILYEISLAARVRKPALVFVEDVLPDSLIPQWLLQRRYSRTRLLREFRTHKHALATLKAYMGSEPPPTYQPSITQRSCLLLGLDALPLATQSALTHYVESKRYHPLIPQAPPKHMFQTSPVEALATDATLSVVIIDRLSSFESYLLGTVRGALIPSILLTLNPEYSFELNVPKEYQPRVLPSVDANSVCECVAEQIDIYEEDYLDVVDQTAVHRYKEALLTQVSKPGTYASAARDLIVNYVAGNLEVDMSKDKIQVQNVVGPVNIKSRLDDVTQVVNTAGSLRDVDREAFKKLVAEMTEALSSVADKRPDDTARVASTIETVGAELAKPKPNRGFLNITAEGLKEAAKALADIAPQVISVAGRIAAFITGLPS